MAKSNTSLTRRRPGGLSKYNPKKGMQQIAVAEVAEKYYRKARDLAGLEKAIRAKLTAQAEFVLWWDTQAEKSAGGRPRKTGPRSVTGLKCGEKGLPSKQTLQRWRKRLGLPEAFERTYQSAVESAARSCDGVIDYQQLRTIGSDEWYTSLDVIDAARELMGGIDFDPASAATAQGVVKAGAYLSTDGETAVWPEKSRVWCNPPYSMKSAFCARLVAHDGPWVALLPAAHLDAQAMQGILRAASAFVLVEGRLTFWREGESGKNVLGSLIACSKDFTPKQFRAAFGKVVDGVFVQVVNGKS